MNKSITESAGTEEDQEFISFVWSLFSWGRPSAEDAGRKVIITPYEGAYGIAGHVIAIHGSPPRGVVYVPSDHTAIAFAGTWKNAKTIHLNLTPASTKKMRTILNYLKHRGYQPASPV